MNHEKCETGNDIKPGETEHTCPACERVVSDGQWIDALGICIACVNLIYEELNS